jgi:hypothetical protein
MFIKINLILSILFLSLNASDLKITEKGIFSSKKNKIIATNIKSSEAVYYSFYIKQFEKLGTFLYYETNSQFKKKCYIPMINNNNNEYFVKELTCFELSLNNGEEAFWSGNSILLKNFNKLSEINVTKIINDFNSKLIDSVTYSLGVFDKQKQQLIFKNLNLKDDKLNIISNNHRFKSKIEHDIPSLDLFNLIVIKDIKRDTISKEIKIEKEYLYDTPNKESKTKMYLIKGDEVEILEEKDDWLYILYKGKKDIKAWIPKSAIEETQIQQEIKPVSKLNQNTKIQS